MKSSHPASTASLAPPPGAPTLAREALEHGTNFWIGDNALAERYANGGLGGNACPPPHDNLVQALRVTKLPPGAWVQEARVDNVFNRILLYKASLVHSATGYFGQAMADRRLTVAFFWMAD